MRTMYTACVWRTLLRTMYTVKTPFVRASRNPNALEPATQGRWPSSILAARRLSLCYRRCLDRGPPDPSRDLADVPVDDPITFPKDDTAFAAFARSTIAALDARARVDPVQVQAALRRWHTRAQVRPRDALASLGETTWYVYRDGHAGVRLEQDWWQADGVATARLGEDEVFVDGDDAACRLVDLPPGGLRGVPWRVLVPPEARETDGEWLFGPLKDGRPVQSVFDFPRADGVDGSSNTGRSGSPTNASTCAAGVSWP